MTRRAITQTEEIAALRDRIRALEAQLRQSNPNGAEAATATGFDPSPDAYHQILNAISAMILVKGPKSRILWANKAFCDYYGMSNEQLLDIIDAPFSEPDHTQQYIKDDAYVFGTGQTLDIPEEPVNRFDGAIRYFRTVKSAIRDESNQVVMTVGVSVDITEHRFVEQELRVSKEAAVRANRLKSEFLANMSHEIRTPMNGVVGMTSLLADTVLNAEQREYLDTIKISADGLITVINDILDFSKVEAGRMEIHPRPIEFRKLIDRTVRLLSTSAKQKQITVATQIDDSIPEWILADDTRIGQILVNLIGNAVKFTGEGGSILIYAVSENNGKLRCSVIDSGIGIEQTKINSVFEPFSQADDSTTRKYGGTGLGLSISKKLAELMGGSLWATSVTDVGSGFHMILPLYPAIKPESSLVIESNPPEQAQSSEQLGGRSLRVLLVEDNLVNQKLAARILEKRGFVVTVTDNGRLAVDLLVSNKSTTVFDVVLMDCQMPVMGGFEATAQIRNFEKKSGQHIPIIALTANALDGDRQACLAAGMDDYVSKPLEPELLVRTILHWTTQPE